MEEQFEIFDDHDKRIGLCARSEVHRRGYWHRSANVFLFRSDGRLIIQRRHQDKDVWPNAWDLSAAEHLKPGESFHAGAVRGVWEELGIKNIDLTHWGNACRFRLDVPETHIKDFEIQMSFHGVSDAEINQQGEEVAEIKIAELSWLKQTMLEDPDSFTPWFHERAQALALF